MKKFLITTTLILASLTNINAQEEVKKESTVAKFFQNPKGDLNLEVLISALKQIGPPEFKNKVILYDSAITKSTIFKSVKDIKFEIDPKDPLSEFRFIESFLTLNGYSIVPSDPYLLVMKSQIIPQYNIKILDEDETKNIGVKHDEISAKMVNTIYVPSAEIIRALDPFLNKQNNDVKFLALPSTNGIMILGPKSTISFLVNIIKILDVPGEKKRIEIFKVKSALPKDLTTKIKELKSAPAVRAPGASPSTGPIIMPDDRTMQIIVKGTEDEIKEIGDLLKLLDQDIINPTATAPIRFLKLKNAKAEEVAATLNNLYSRIKEQLPVAGAAPGAQPRAVVSGVGPAQSRDDIPTIVAEKTINALLVIGADADAYKYLQDIVELLDKRRDQVMITGTIIEMSETKAWDLAVELAAINASRINTAGAVNPYGVTNFGKNTISIDGDKPGRVPGLGSAFTTGFTYGSQEALPFILNASQTDSEVHSIAQPSITANDNQQATISITRSVPYETTSTGTNQVTNSNVQFKDAPISLQIKPTINAPDRVDAEKYVILEVNVNVTTLDFSQLSAGGSPGSNARTATTVVTVPDKGVVVIGGLSGLSADRGEKKVPLLGDIPLLGNLFKSQNRNKTKSNIYIFLSPIIMTNFREAEDYAREKGILFDSDKKFYGELKKRVWSNNLSGSTNLRDSDFYPKKFMPQK
jgi:general secretion pathway protein D